MTYLGFSQAQLESAGGIWTAQEISQQPAVWTKLADLMARETAALRFFLQPLLERTDLRIVLTGAGSSAFVGECLVPALRQATRRRVEAVSTTDIVASPESVLEPDAPTLLISFGRSGNSPESLAALTLAEQLVASCHHLIVTCNGDGELHRCGKTLENAYVLQLPEETHDRGFAMTSSFTAMMLATALAFRALPQQELQAVPAWAAGMLEQRLPYIAGLAREGFERIVYLGGRDFKGLAREAVVKTLELSDGRVVALSETPLGFRHGPKTIVNGKTLIVVFLSNDAYAAQYERDLLRELCADAVAAKVVALSGGAAGQAELPQTDWITLPEFAGASNLALCLPYAVFAQSLAFLQSMALGLRPDTPNARGVVNRVVKGVTIYPWKGA